MVLQWCHCKISATLRCRHLLVPYGSRGPRDVVGCARFFIPARRAATSSSLHVEELGGTKIETIWVLILVPPRGARVD